MVIPDNLFFIELRNIQTIISVFPNPVSEYFSIALKPTSAVSKRKVEVLDAKGSVIYSNELPGAADKVIISAADWHSGLYYYRIYSADSIETGKIVRQ